MSLIRGEQKCVAERDEADYLSGLGREFVGRFPGDGVRQWAAIILREAGGESWSRIAQALEGLSSESSARCLYQRAKKNLAVMLDLEA